MLVTAKAISKTVLAKEVGIVGTGLSAPLWLPKVQSFLPFIELINSLLATLIGVCTLVYVYIRMKKARNGEV